MTISVIIPTYNGEKLLEQSLPPLYTSLYYYQKTCKADWEIIVVDNNSVDGTSDYIKQTYPAIKYIYLPSNRGFTVASNIGAKKAKGDYLLFLNNDCFLEKQTIKDLYTFLYKNDEFVATQPIVYTPQGAIENIGYSVDLKKGKARVIIDKKKIPPVTVQKDLIFGLSATCLFIKKDIFIEVGLFDEKFHSYLEDVDLFLNLAKRKYTYAPNLESSCIHRHMATSKTMGFYKEKRDIINWIRIIRKHYSMQQLIRYAPSLFLERLRNINGLLKKIKF